MIEIEEARAARLKSNRFHTGLKILASFGCDHVRASGDPQQHCDKYDGQRGGCCNSCWARRFAKWIIEGK